MFGHHSLFFVLGEPHPFLVARKGPSFFDVSCSLALSLEGLRASGSRPKHLGSKGMLCVTCAITSRVMCRHFAGAIARCNVGIFFSCGFTGPLGNRCRALGFDSAVPRGFF